MTNNFFTEVENGTCGLRFWCYIQGIPYVFCDGELPVNSSGTDYLTAPNGFSGQMPGTYANPSTFTVLENALDLSRSLDSVGADISRRTGITQPGSMRLTLRDDGSDVLTELLATNLSSAIVTEVRADFTRTATTLLVDSVTDFPAFGTIFIGKEMLVYTGTATDGGGGGHRFTGVTRNACALFGNDVYYDHEDYAASAPRTVSTNPRTWVGRYVRVFALCVDEFGRAFNTDWRNDFGYQQEIFRGILQQPPRVVSDFTRWTITATGLESILDTEIGGGFPEGQMINVPGNQSMNQAGYMDPSGELVGAFDPTNPPIIIMDGSNRIHMEIYEYATSIAAQGQAGPISTHDYTGDDAGTVVGEFDLSDIDAELVGSVASWGQMFQWIKFYINALIADAGFEEDIFASVFAGGADGPHGVKITAVQDTASTKGYRLKFHWDRKNSVSQLVGVSEPQEVLVLCESGTTLGVAMTTDKQTKGDIVGIISEHATQLIYWLKPQESGLITKTPIAADGFVLVGEKEVVKYEDDVDVNAVFGAGAGLFWKGMRVLKGCTRGMFGTPATRHVMTVDESRKAQSDPLSMKFGFGADDQSWPVAFLELATSTGTASHNGAYDVRSKHESAAICDEHFHLPSFKTYDESESDDFDKKINYFSAGSVTLKSFIESFLMPRMVFIMGNYNADGSHQYTYQLQLVRIRPPLESETAVSLTHEDIDFDDPATFMAGNKRVVNRIRCHYRWNFAEEKADDDQVIATDWDSVQDHGGVKAITWKLRGQSWSYSQAYTRVSMWALRAFQRWGHDFDIMNVKTNRRGLSVRPGDTVALTLDGVPTKQGSRGMVEQTGVCIRADHTWHDPNGSPSSMLTLVFEHDQRNSTYCPGALVYTTATIDGDPGLILYDHTFTADGGAHDAEHFEAGDKIVIYNRGDYASRDERTIASITTHTIGPTTYDALIVNSALSNADVNDGAYVVAQQYDDATADQKKHAFVANDAGVLSESNTESFKYS